jgi:glycosyltransferase involved in cell wall biosynthesis
LDKINARVFFHSVHASLEHDMALIFKHLGITIAKANMDRSYAERPEIPGYTGIDWGDEMRNRVDNLACNKEDFDGCDFAFIMNPSDFHWRVEHFSRFVPTVAYVNGQWLENQLDEFAGKMNKQWDAQSEPRTSEKCNIWVAVYTKHEEEYLRKRVHTQLQDRIHHIRFCKRIEDYYNPSTVRMDYIYTTCNDIHNRGDSCYWKEWQEIARNSPGDFYKLSGRNTDMVGGLGLIPFPWLVENMQTCAGYLGVPCYPAPLVLNVVEAMCAGAPVAFYDNQRGIKGEGIFEGVGCLSDNTGTLRNFLKRCLDDKAFREDQAAKSLARAKELFAFETQVEKWRVLFSQMEALWK